MSSDNVVNFPQPFHVVRLEPPSPSDDLPVLVEHDGRIYGLAGLLQHLPADRLRALGDTIPRSGQDLWDEVVRHWPVMAADIAAVCRPAD